MIYRLKEFKGDTIPVPQLVFSKLGIAEEYNVRVALYVLATGITDPEKLCADLKLRSKMTAESALSFWAGAGLLERYEENAAPGEEPTAPAPMTWSEIAAASRTDPMISSLIDCAQTSFARPLTHPEMEKLVNFYVQEAFAPETVMLCVAYVASRGKRTMGAVSHELKVWRAEGVETGEQADAHLQLLALRAQREQYVSGLLGIADTELTLGGRKAIARWYEVYGYDDAMVQEAAVQAGPKRDPLVLEQHPQDLERQGPAHRPRCAGPGGRDGCQPEPPGGPRRTQRKRFSQERCPPPSAPQKDGHACRIRSFYAYQTGTVSSRPAHGGSAAADRPRQCRGCPAGGGGRHPGPAPR